MTSGVPPLSPQFCEFDDHALPATETPDAERTLSVGKQQKSEPERREAVKRTQEWRRQNRDRYLAHTREQSKRWREEHRDQHRASTRQYYAEHRDQHRASTRQYYAEHREQCLAYQRACRAAEKIGPEAVAAFKEQWREDHPRAPKPLRSPRTDSSQPLRRRLDPETPQTIEGLLPPSTYHGQPLPHSVGRLDDILRTPPPSQEHPSTSNPEDPDDVGQNPSDEWRIPSPPPENFFPS